LSFLKKVLAVGCLVALLLIFPLSLVSTRFLLKPFRWLSRRTTEITADQLAFRFTERKQK
jgi:peptidoglycan/LPS O-acetylase OafA/YrhL